MSENSDEEIETAFEVGDRVLAWHGPFIYDAQILNIKNEEGDTFYFVHYAGWKKIWDEWITDDRVLEKNEENIDLQREVKADATMAKNKKKKTPAKQRRKLDEGIELEEETSMKYEIQIPIPSALQKLLITDWENVNQKTQLVPLPSKPSIDSILDEFIKSKTRKPDALKVTHEVINGFRIYFQRALPTRLLYKSERPQYDDIINTSKDSTTNIYGIEHLIRLFVTMPQLMAATKMTKEQKATLLSKISEFLKFLTKNTEWFSSEYTPMDPQYLERVKNLEPSHVKT